MKKFTFLFLAGFLIITGCISNYFSMIDSQYLFTGDRIAVVSGLEDEVSVYLAEKLSRELDAKTTFNVMPSVEIINRVPGYPMKIRGPYSAAYFGIDEDYTKTDVDRIKKIMSKLDVDYLCVLWAPSVVQSGRFIQIHIITQLFEFPSFHEVAHARYYIRYEAKMQTTKGRPEKWHISNAKMDSISTGGRDKMEKEIGDVTGNVVKAVIKASGKGKTGP